MKAQLEMFGAEPSTDDSPVGLAITLPERCLRFGAAPVDEGNVVGLKVKLDRPVDRERPCCLNVCTIGAGRGPHAGELICAGCGQHRGWLSKQTAGWIESVVTHFGALTTPIVVRKSYSYEEEAPDTASTPA